MIFREPAKKDREQMIQLMNEFYHSPAVLHPIPRSHFEKTFKLLESGSPFAKAYLIEEEGEPAGYALLALTYSNEAGGMTMWIDELYIRPSFQGKGLGKAFFDFLKEQWDGKIFRYRLEIEPDNGRARELYYRLGYQDLPYVQLILDRKEE